MGITIEDDELSLIYDLLLGHIATLTRDLAEMSPRPGKDWSIERIIQEGRIDHAMGIADRIKARRALICPECNTCEPYRCKMDCTTKKFR